MVKNTKRNRNQRRNRTHRKRSTRNNRNKQGGKKVKYCKRRTAKLGGNSKKLTPCQRYHRGHHIKKPGCCAKKGCVVRRN